MNTNLYELDPARLRAIRVEGDARRLARRWGEAVEAIEGAGLGDLARRLRAAGDLGEDVASVDELLTEIRGALHRRRDELGSSPALAMIAGVRRAIDTVGALWSLIGT